jgi:hypothetical protein
MSFQPHSNKWTNAPVGWLLEITAPPEGAEVAAANEVAAPMIAARLTSCIV